MATTSPVLEPAGVVTITTPPPLAGTCFGHLEFCCLVGELPLKTQLIAGHEKGYNNMDVYLSPENNRIAVTVDGAPSHTFPLADLRLGKWDDEIRAYRLEDPVALGKSLFAALFPENSPAMQAAWRAKEAMSGSSSSRLWVKSCAASA